MVQKLTEEQQRSAHKIIKANRGDCAKKGNYLNCINCPRTYENYQCLGILYPNFKYENLRRSQAWLDAHITDAEILAESPREFCERMVRTEGNGKCFASIKGNNSLCKNCVISINGNGCCTPDCLIRAKAYLASHQATTTEPPKRRPTPDEMVVGATVRVRLWDELVRDGVLDSDGDILFQKSASFFNKAMRQFCGTTHKVIKGGRYSRLDGCDDWRFIPEMLDYVEPEKVVDPKSTKVNFFDLCETKDAAKPEPVANAPRPDTLRIIALEGQVDDLTKKLAASTRKCDRQQRRLRANWEAKRDGEMATREEIIAWFDAGKGAAIINGSASRIRLMNRTDWIPATRGNLKL